MKVTANNLMFFVDLFDDYKKKVYVQMRKDKYSMNNITSFINGYSIVTHHCYEYAISKSYKDGDIFWNAAFNNKDEAIKMINIIVNNIHNFYLTSNQWEKIGIKYALCLAKFYIENVIFGDDTIVEEDELYLCVPEEDDPDSYDWEMRGFDYNF